MDNKDKFMKLTITLDDKNINFHCENKGFTKVERLGLLEIFKFQTLSDKKKKKKNAPI